MGLAGLLCVVLVTSAAWLLGAWLGERALRHEAEGNLMFSHAQLKSKDLAREDEFNQRRAIEAERDSYRDEMFRAREEVQNLQKRNEHNALACQRLREEREVLIKRNVVLETAVTERQWAAAKARGRKKKARAR